MPTFSHISWATQDDAAALAPLLRVLYRHDVPEAPVPTDADVSAHIARLMDPATPHRLAIAWDDRGAAVGLAAVALFFSVSDPRPERQVQMELKELFVLAGYRSAGLGTALMAWIEAEAVAAGACRIDWHVKRDNDRAIAFYRRGGADILQERRSMRKPLLSG
ncbi:MAG: GNAT family N-acetyltransferase [Pseudomonadota bacterium]